MRRIVMFNQVSVDGRFASAEGTLDWVVQDPEIGRDAVASMPGGDQLIFGRQTYEMFASFWPTEAAKSGTDPHGGKPSKETAAMATWLNEAAKIVFSKTLKKASWGPAEIFSSLDPDAIRALKNKPGKDIMIFGSGSVVTQLTEHRLIDQYDLIVCPVLLGAGRSFLGGISGKASLRLVESRAFSSGNVRLRYVPA